MIHDIPEDDRLTVGQTTVIPWLNRADPLGGSEAPDVTRVDGGWINSLFFIGFGLSCLVAKTNIYI